MISFVLFPQATEPSVNFNTILPMGLIIPVILVIYVILSSHPCCPNHPIHPIHLSHPSNFGIPVVLSWHSCGTQECPFQQACFVVRLHFRRHLESFSLRYLRHKQLSCGNHVYHWFHQGQQDDYAGIFEFDKRMDFGVVF